MKIAFNPSTVAALTTPPNNKDITFDLRGRNIFARGVKFYGTDTNTWRDIKVNNVSIGSHTLDLRNGSNTTLTNTNGVVTINSTWRPVVDNLTSNSTTSSLSANQGRVLKALIDGKSDSGHNHDGRYVRYYAVTTLDCNNLAVGLTAARVSATNAAHTNHSVYLYISDIGTPFQIQIPDSNVPYIYKRYYSSGKWSGWFKLNAGYADSAGSVAWSNITGKPSSYTPSAHTHAWNSLTHSSTTENQAILTNGKANGWKLYTLNISGWNNAANNAHSHANKSVLDGITSGLVNNWNTAYTFVHTITGTDTDKVINKWDEIVNFLAGITEDNKLNTLLNSKLSVYELADKTNVGTIKNNGIYYSTTEASTGTLTNSPFTNAFALINMTNLNNNEDQLRRCRLAFSRVGDIKVSDDHLDDGTAETWYNVLTSKNSGIDGSTIKLNGTSITVYSSGTADGRYVKKSGDTMTGVLTIDTTNFGTLTIKRNNDADGASIQFRGKSSVYGYIGFNAANRNKQLLRWNDAGSQVYTILDTSSTYTSGGKGVINGTTITQVDNADKLDGYHANTSQSPFGRVPTIGGDGVMEIGKYIDFHYDNEGKYDYSTRLQATGNHQNTLLLPSGTGTLALTSQIPNKNSWNYDDRYLKLTGGAMVGTINRRSGGSTISGRDHAIIRQTYAPGGSSWNPIACVDTETGTWTLGHLSSGSSNTDFSFCFSTNADYNAGNNAGNYVTLRNRVGTIALTSEIPSKGSWNYDDRYYTKAESNAKYITDITTSVNKLTFTKNGSSIARTITVNNVQSLGKRSPLTERNAISGIYTYGTYSATDNLAPTNYFETLGFGEGVAGTIEIGGSWISGGKLYWRALRDCCEDWFSWKTILDSSNYSSILDSRYYTESEVNSLLSKKLDRVNLSVGTWNPRGYNLAADYHYNGGDLSISENGGKMYVSIDGQFYQNEGQYRVLDTSDIGSIRGGLTLYQYLSSTDTNWFPLIWGGSDHKNTNNSTGSLYKSYDKLSWQTSSQTLYATNIQTENIKHLSIGGGIYWNPDVESATDGSDAASITLVKSGVAGGTTLVLSQMNDANDTIQFKTSTAAKLYHNSYPILTTQNTYVSNNKGYINGTEITQVNNAHMVNNYHILDESKQIYKSSYTVDNPGGTWILIKFPAWNAVHEVVSIDGYGDNRRAHCIVHCGSRYQGIWGYQSDYNGTVVDRIGWKEVDSGKFALVALINGGITSLSVRATNSLEISKTTEGGSTFVIASSFFSSGGFFHGNVYWDNIIGKPQTFNPATHTHTVFRNNLMIKGTNGVSDSASIHLGIGDSDTGFKWISDGKCQIYANNAAIGQWTSGGMNWFANPTVNGNKVWNAGNDGSGSGLDADTVDGEHASNFSYTHQSSFDFNTIKNGRIVTFDQSNTDYSWINGFASTHNNYLTSVLFNTHRTSNWYVGYIEGNSSTGKTKGLQAVHKLAFADQIPTSLKNPYSLTLKANGTTLAIYDGSSAKEANFTYANVGAASASHTHTYIVAEDLRNKYPAQILDPRRMKLSFLAASTLGIKNNGTYYDVITVRSYGDATAGSDNALLFSKNTNSLYHTRFAFGSTDSWGSPLLIIDSGNIGSQSVNYANSANHANSAGNANTLGGTSLGGLFTAFGNNAHNITATIGGVTKSFLVNWAADSDKLDGKHASDFATVGHNHDSRYVKIWGNVEANFNFPDGEGHSGVYMCHTTKTQSNKPETYGLLTDFSTVNGHLQFFGASSNKIYTRTYWWTGQDNFKYTDWHTLLHTGNSSVSGHTITINGTSTTWSNSWRPIGTGASDAAAGNHTHKVKINGSEKTIAATGVTDLGTYLTSQSLRGYVHAYNNTGTGNAVTSISIEGGTITANKGTTFLTSHQSLANYYTKGQVDTKLGKYLPLAGGTMDAGAQIQRTAKGGMWYQGRSIALLRETSADGYHALWSLKTTDGSWDFGEYNSSGWNNIPVLSYVLDSNFDKGSNITTYQIKFPLASGTIALTSNILNPTNYYWANNKITSTSKIDAEVRVKNLGAGCSTTIENTIMATNWVRAMGNTGIYFQDHGGGLYMSDNTWIRTWAGKALQVDNTIRSTDFHTTYYANNVWTITSAARLENSTTLVYGTNTSSQSINTYLRGTNVTLQVKKGTSPNYNALQLTSDRINCNNYCDMKYGAAVSGGNFTVQNNAYLAQKAGAKVGIGTGSPSYTLDVRDNKMRAGGYVHFGYSSDDAVLLAGGGYAQGVPVKYWSIEFIQIFNSKLAERTTSPKGNYIFITKIEPYIDGSCKLTLQFPSGYNRDNTMIWAMGILRQGANYGDASIYATIVHSSGSEYHLNLADDATLNNGTCQLYFMCF